MCHLTTTRIGTFIYLLKIKKNLKSRWCLSYKRFLVLLLNIKELKVVLLFVLFFCLFVCFTKC